MKRPSLFLYFTEMIRSFFERMSSRKYRKAFKQKDSGKGRNLLVIPGFLTSHTSTKVLRDFLSKLGYDVHDWGLGRNLGDSNYHLEKLSEKVQSLYFDKNQKIVLIGWSLGGIYARELAKLFPEKVQEVVTLGSPFGGVEQPNNANWLFDLINKIKRRNKIDRDWIAKLPEPAPVKTTAVYSEIDGIVPWQFCMEKVEDDLHKNVKINGSHTGLGFNQKVFELLDEILG